MAGNKNSGRRPKPTNLKVLEGNPGKRPLPEDEPQPDPPANLEPPEHLSDRAKDFWRQYAEPLAKLGLLTELDLASFELLCGCWAKAKRAEDELERQGNVLAYETAAGNKIIKNNPNLSAWNINVSLFNKLAQKFGLAAADRAGLKVPDSNTVEGPAAFFGGRKKRDRDKDNL